MSEFKHMQYDMDGIKREVTAEPVNPKHNIMRRRRTKLRKCRICNQALGPSRYFNHKECITSRVGEYYDLAEHYDI